MQQQRGISSKDSTAANGHANGTPADPGPLIDVLHKVKQCQQQRARQYNAFSASFRYFLESKDETPYRQAMVEATRVFAEVNEVVRSLERRLRHELHDDTLADSLAALQKGEEAKLRFTLIQQADADCWAGWLLVARALGHPVQALKQSANEGRFSWQNSAGDARSSSANAQTSLPTPGSHQDRLEPHGCCAAVAEPTEQEFSNALAEATQELQAAVILINNILMELQEVEEDLNDKT